MALLGAKMPGAGAHSVMIALTVLARADYVCYRNDHVLALAASITWIS